MRATSTKSHSRIYSHAKVSFITISLNTNTSFFLFNKKKEVYFILDSICLFDSYKIPDEIERLGKHIMKLWDKFLQKKRNDPFFFNRSNKKLNKQFIKYNEFKQKESKIRF